MQYVIIIYAWKILPETREDNANKRILSSVGTVNKMKGEEEYAVYCQFCPF